jgi:hypothetical protein
MLAFALPDLSWLETKIDTIDGIVDTILADTNELQTNQGNWLTADVSALATSAEITALNDISAEDVWTYVTRELTSAGAGGATAQEVWEYAARSLTTNADIADAVWDELLSGHTDTGSAGKIVSDISSAVTVIDGLIDSIKTVTDKLDAMTANTGTYDRFLATALELAPNADTTAAQIWSYATRTLTDPDSYKADLTTVLANLTTLLSRLSSVRATYLDYLDDIYADAAELNDTKLTTERAGNIDNLDVAVSTRSDFDNETELVIANIDTSDLEIDISTEVIQNAMRTYPDSLPAGENPAFVMPPENTSYVKIYALCYNKESSTPMTDCTGTLELLLPTEEDNKFHDAETEAGTYADDTGELYWHVPPYAKVKVIIPALKINTTGYTGAGAELIRVDNLYKVPQNPTV